MRGRNRTRSDRHGREASAGSRRHRQEWRAATGPARPRKKKKYSFCWLDPVWRWGGNPGEAISHPPRVQRRNTPKDFFHRQEAAKRERKPLYLWA